MGRQRFEVDLRLDFGLDALRERHGRVVRPQELRTEGEGHAYPVHAWCEGKRRHLHTLLVYTFRSSNTHNSIAMRAHD